MHLWLINNRNCLKTLIFASEASYLYFDTLVCNSVRSKKRDFFSGFQTLYDTLDENPVLITKCEKKPVEFSDQMYTNSWSFKSKQTADLAKTKQKAEVCERK